MLHDTSFRVVPIAAAVARSIRQSRVDGFGNGVVVIEDGRPHQCRACLRLSAADERVLLMAYRPFDTAHPYAETGPVFIHERECGSYAAVNQYPSEFPRSEVIVRAYDARDRIVGAEAVGLRNVEDVITAMLASAETAYLHARNLGYGCFMFRIERH